MEDENEDRPAIGARPKHNKQPNPINEPRRQREREVEARRNEEQNPLLVQAEGEPAQQAQEEVQQILSKIPPFGDGSRIIKDWTTSGLFGDPINQHKDTCGSVVFTKLLQASYNKDKPITQRRELSYKDLANHIKNITKKDVFSFRNMNIPIKYIKDVGLHKDDKILGPGVKTKGDFSQRQDATKQFVFDTLETTPLGIVIEDYAAFQNIGMGIYDVPALRKEKVFEHSMLVVGKGITKDGVDFIVVQNSWGVGFGNSGYCRLCLPTNGKFKIFWPL